MGATDHKFLTATEYLALARFAETCEDGEGYDVPKAMMQRLAQVGAVRRTYASVYQITEFGDWLLGENAPQAAQQGEAAGITEIEGTIDHLAKLVAAHLEKNGRYGEAELIKMTLLDESPK